MASLWKELRRRNVVRVGLAYVLVAWVLLQVTDFALDVIDAPNWIMQVLVLLAAVGLPAVLVFAWVFEMTSEGLKLESEVERDESITHHTGKKLNFVIIGVLALAVVFLGTRQYLAPGGGAEPASEGETYSSIAVLPFEDYSEAGDQEHFSKGIAEEVLNLLAKTQSLHVAARTSSFAFAGTDTDIREIGQMLDVGTVLEGSIRKSGPNIRVTAQLIDVENGYHLWSETYDRDYSDIFKIQDEIAASIMGSLKVHLLGEEAQHMVSERTADVDAYNAYLIGKERLALRTKEDIEAARAKFEEALEIDPDFAPAHAHLAQVLMLLEQRRYEGQDIDREENDKLIVPHLDRALELSPDLPEAVAIKGWHDLRRYRFEEAEKAFDRAIALNPNYALAYTWRAETAYEQERFLDMLADKEKAYSLDPMSLEISSELAYAYRSFWRPKDAERVINRMFDLQPDHPMAFEAAMANLDAHGRSAEVALMAERALAAHPDNEDFRSWLAWGLMDVGLIDEAEAINDDDVNYWVYLRKEDWAKMEELLEEQLARERPTYWYSYARYYEKIRKVEGWEARYTTYLNDSIEGMEKAGFNWQDQCMPYFIQELQEEGRTGATESMLAECNKVFEERLRVKYLCPCSWYGLVLYTIVDGRYDDAVERADQWLSNGDSQPFLDIDPLFSLLSDRPEYPELLRRNAAQIERQREIYLSGNPAGEGEKIAVNQ